MKNKIMPTHYLLIALLICPVIHLLAPIRTILPPYWNLLGLIPLLFGIWINLRADRAFKNAETTVKPFQESSTLVREGVFKLSRNPMYLGFAAVLLGISILLRSLSPYLVVLIFVVFMDRVYIRVEEKMLGEQFGQAWVEYCKEVRKWI